MLGVMYNCSNNRTSGFTASKNNWTLNLIEEIISLAEDCACTGTDVNKEKYKKLGNNEESVLNQAATYANVFCI